jgi:hypothetical protein
MELDDALRVKTAEFWLKLGQKQQAMAELQRLSRRALSHPWAQTILHSASRAF